MSPEESVTLPATTPTARPPATRMTVVMVLVLVVLAGALAVVGYSVVALTHDRDGWRAVAEQVQQQNDELRGQVAEASTVQACRSRANFNTVRATAEVIQIISALILAQGDQTQVAAIRGTLPAANANLDAAIVAQDAAIPDQPGDSSTCNAGPP